MTLSSASFPSNLMAPTSISIDSLFEDLPKPATSSSIDNISNPFDALPEPATSNRLIPFEDLPDEVILLINHSLELPDQKALSQTCRKMNSIVKSHQAAIQELKYLNKKMFSFDVDISRIDTDEKTRGISKITNYKFAPRTITKNRVGVEFVEEKNLYQDKKDGRYIPRLHSYIGGLDYFSSNIVPEENDAALLLGKKLANITDDHEDDVYHTHLKLKKAILDIYADAKNFKLNDNLKAEKLTYANVIELRNKYLHKRFSDLYNDDLLKKTYEELFGEKLTPLTYYKSYDGSYVIEIGDKNSDFADFEENMKKFLNRLNVLIIKISSPPEFIDEDITNFDNPTCVDFVEKFQNKFKREIITDSKHHILDNFFKNCINPNFPNSLFPLWKKLIFDPILDEIPKEVLFNNLISTDMDNLPIFAKIIKTIDDKKIILIKDLLQKLDPEQRINLLDSKCGDTDLFNWYININYLSRENISIYIAKQRVFYLGEMTKIALRNENELKKYILKKIDFFINRKYFPTFKSELFEWFIRIFEEEISNLSEDNLKETYFFLYLIHNEKRFFEKLETLSIKAKEQILLDGVESIEPFINHLISQRRTFFNRISFLKKSFYFENMPKEKFIEKAIKGAGLIGSIGDKTSSLLIELLTYELPYKHEYFKFLFKYGNGIECKSFIDRHKKNVDEKELQKGMLENIKFIKTMELGNQVLNLLNVKDMSYEQRVKIVKESPWLYSLNLDAIPVLNVNNLLLPVLIIGPNRKLTLRLENLPDSGILGILKNEDADKVEEFLKCSIHLKGKMIEIIKRRKNLYDSIQLDPKLKELFEKVERASKRKKDDPSERKAMKKRR